MITASTRPRRGSAPRLVSRIQLELGALVGEADEALLRRRIDRGHTRARALPPSRTSTLGEIARVGADLDDRARACRVETGQQELREVLQRMRPATGVLRVRIDLRLLPLHERRVYPGAHAVPGRRLPSPRLER